MEFNYRVAVFDIERDVKLAGKTMEWFQAQARISPRAWISWKQGQNKPRKRLWARVMEVHTQLDKADPKPRLQSAMKELTSAIGAVLEEREGR